jgi:hypothetical protein
LVSLPALDDLRRLINGYQVSQAIYVTATLGIADALKDDSRTTDELAEATGTDPATLYRLLRALAAVGVLHEEHGQRFALTPLGEQLRADHPQSLGGWAAYVGRPYHWEAWGHLLESVRTGENAFRLLNGIDVWSYRAEHPEESAIFDRAMTSVTGASNQAVLDAYDFGRFGTVCDVGGGNGALLASILAKYPTMHGILFDQPHVVANAEDVLRDVVDRCRVVAGNFFESVPEGADAYVLKAVIHDWDDTQSTTILRTCRRAVEGGVLLLVERLVGPPNEDPAAKFGDLNMLVGPGGQERTLEEFGALFAAAGFELGGVTATSAGLALIEGVPVWPLQSPKRGIDTDIQIPDDQSIRGGISDCGREMDADTQS